MSDRAKTKCLALVGGVGPGAAAHYYLRLAQEARIREMVLDLVMPNADIETVDTYFQSVDPARQAEYFSGLLRRAAAAGAVVGAIPSVSCHYCVGELEKSSPVPVVSLLAAVREEILRRGLKRAALFGAKYAMASKLFGSVPEVEWVEPTAEEFAAIDEMYWVLVRTGKGNAELHEGFTRIAKRLCAEEGAECILFAGTDLAVLFNESNTDFPYLDCGEKHLQAILQAIL